MQYVRAVLVQKVSNRQPKLDSLVDFTLQKIRISCCKVEQWSWDEIKRENAKLVAPQDAKLSAENRSETK